MGRILLGDNEVGVGLLEAVGMVLKLTAVSQLPVLPAQK
jgi:hypothetical protein